MFNRLKKEIQVISEPETINIMIPSDPEKFYQDFGLLKHPLTHQPVKHLTPYQFQIWRDGFRYRYREVIKSQKVGLSTSALMEDFHHSITNCRGQEILIISQSLDLAKDHLYTLRKMIRGSKKYSQFLIDKPNDFLLRDEVTKVMTLYIRNPDDPFKPTRIIGLGPRPGSIWSWKEVAHIHMSDIAAAPLIDDSEVFGAAFSRLANTNGTILIESPPRGPSGKLYEIYENSKLKKTNSLEGQFKIYEIPATMAVQAGLISQEFLDAEQQRLGPMYPMYYECDFYNSSTTWYKPELFDYDDEIGEQLGI